MANPIPIDFIRAGYDQRGHWHKVRPAYVPRRCKDPLDPARGCIYGLLVGGLMWVGIIAGFEWLIR